MNWLAEKRVNIVSMGALFALLIVFFSPNFGLKHGVSPTLPSVLLAFMGIWLALRERVAVLASTAQRRWLLIFALLFVPMLISIPNSYDVQLSAGIAGASVLYAFAGVALIRALKGEGARHWLAAGIMITLSFWVGDSMVQYFLGRDIFGIELTPPPQPRVTGPFDGNLRQATLLSTLLPVALGALLVKPRGLIWAVMFFSFAAAVAMLAGVRMIMVMLAIVAVGLILKVPQVRWRWVIVVSLMAIMAAAIGLSSSLQDRMISRVIAARTMTFEAIDFLTSYRLTIWETGGRMLLDRPLTGVGVGNFDKAYRDYATRTTDIFRDGTNRPYHAHQIYVSAAAEMGFPGLIGLLAALIVAVKWYWSAPPSVRLRAWPWALALLVYFFPLNTQPPMLRQWTFPILLMLIAAMLAALDEPDTGLRTGSTV